MFRSEEAGRSPIDHHQRPRACWRLQGSTQWGLSDGNVRGLAAGMATPPAHIIVSAGEMEPAGAIRILIGDDDASLPPALRRCPPNLVAGRWACIRRRRGFPDRTVALAGLLCPNLWKVFVSG
jgi:hypothetical protein